MSHYPLFRATEGEKKTDETEPDETEPKTPPEHFNKVKSLIEKVKKENKKNYKEDAVALKEYEEEYTLDPRYEHHIIVLCWKIHRIYETYYYSGYEPTHLRMRADHRYLNKLWSVFETTRKMALKEYAKKFASLAPTVKKEFNKWFSSPNSEAIIKAINNAAVEAKTNEGQLKLELLEKVWKMKKRFTVW